MENNSLTYKLLKDINGNVYLAMITNEVEEFYYCERVLCYSDKGKLICSKRADDPFYHLEDPHEPIIIRKSTIMMEAKPSQHVLSLVKTLF